MKGKEGSGPTYSYLAIEEPGGAVTRGFRCHECDTVTYRPEDVERLYCVACRRLHTPHWYAHTTILVMYGGSRRGEEGLPPAPLEVVPPPTFWDRFWMVLGSIWDPLEFRKHWR